MWTNIYPFSNGVSDKRSSIYRRKYQLAKKFIDGFTSVGNESPMDGFGIIPISQSNPRFNTK